MIELDLNWWISSITFGFIKFWLGIVRTFLFIKTKKKSVKTKRRFPFHPSWLISFQTEIQCQWLKKNGLKNLKRQTKIPIFIFQCFAGDASWIQGTDHGPPFLWKKGPAIFSMIIDFLELLKRREQEYFTLVLTKNDSNLVAALSYCSDEGN